MVTKREEIFYDNLWISIESESEEKTFYLSGDTPLFRVIIRNENDKTRYGFILIRWILGNLDTLRPIKFEIGPHLTKKYDLLREWLYREGTGIYELRTMSKHSEEYTSENEIKSEYYSSDTGLHPLCSYYVRDKDQFSYEERYKREMKWIQYTVLFLTIIMVIDIILKYSIFDKLKIYEILLQGINFGIINMTGILENLIGSLNTNSGSITAVATIVLAGITAYYAVLVHATLNEMKKTREIEFIEKKLQKLYYPIKGALDSACDWIIDHNNEEQLNGSIDLVDSTLNEVRLYKHLYSQELRELTKEFSLMHRRHHSDSKNFDNLVISINKMRELVDKDIEKYQKRLDEIIL